MIPDHTFQPYQLMKVLERYFFRGEAVYSLAQRCHPERPLYLLYSDTPEAPNQVRWQKKEGVWVPTSGLSYWTEKALVETAIEKGIPTD